MDNISPSEHCLGKYAFLIHPTSAKDLYESGPPEFCDLAPMQRKNWEQWIASWSRRHYDPGIAYHLPAIHSKMGGYAEGWLIAIPLTPEQMLRLKPNDRDKLMAKCVEMATDLGIDMLGLGAFTSIVTRGGTDLLGYGINITTGNSLTAMIAAESLKLIARLRGKDLTHAKIGVVGAAGSVGRLACMQLASAGTDLTLFGNPANSSSVQKLAAVAGEIYRHALEAIMRDESATGIGLKILSIVDDIQTSLCEAVMNPNPETHRCLYDAVTRLLQRRDIKPPVTLTVDLKCHLPQIQFILSATSQSKSFIDVHLLSPGAVVCDTARPPDIHADVRASRPDVFVYEGGLVKLPEPISFGRRNIIGCKAGVNLACLSETIVLTMSGIRHNYSIGTEPPIDQAQEVFQLAQQHGFNIYLQEMNQSDISIPCIGI
jgi:predicted amino acid dehydrogenase